MKTRNPAVAARRLGEMEPLEFKDLSVLLVDDEPQVLKSLSRTLRGEGYQVLTALSGEEALEILSSRNVHLILADQRMPGMSGIELLVAAAKTYPDAVRVMLTGFADLKVAEAAINQVEIYRFLTKPWNDEDVKITLREGLKTWLLSYYNRRLTMRIETQNRELLELNQELEKRVEERTRQLQETQLKLVQAEKMSSLGILAGGVAHEINNPLSGIMALTQVLLMEKQDAPMAEDLRQIEQGVLQCKEIVQGLLSFARQSDDRHREEVYLPAVVDRTLPLLDHELRQKAIEFEVEYDSDLPLIWANPAHLQQMLINLVINAVQAMDRGGKIALRARARSDQGVELEVEDQGPGIPDELRAKIFDPFFTTKPAGQGTGLGLSITYGLVQDHDGRIEVESGPGQGALFRLIFPPLPALDRRGDCHAA